LLTPESQGVSQPTLLWLAVPKHALSEPSVLDIFPLDLLSPCHTGSQGWQRIKYLSMSAFHQQIDRHFNEQLLQTLTCKKGFLSQYLTNLMHKICFTISFISCLYIFRAYVLIIRRSKLHYTASGIITPIGVMIPEVV
jgi:hypothetical protein